jgi:hypothetical protein
MKTTTLPLKYSMNRLSCPLALLLIPLALACFAPAPTARAVCQEGCFANNNTVLGDDALVFLTGLNDTAIGASALHSNTIGFGNTANGAFALYLNTTGFGNTAAGDSALHSNTTGIDLTASGGNALYNNTTGSWNTATGQAALYNNTTGNDNTATGTLALVENTTGENNTATGGGALFENTTGNFNTANGLDALFNNTSGSDNTATGELALLNNTTGYYNTADGEAALGANTTGSNNTAEGQNALVRNTAGSNNIALGSNAGFFLTTGSNNIDIGNKGVAGELNTIRIGRQGTQTAIFIAGISGASVPGGVGVIVDSSGHLGTVVSSQRFKDEIRPMDKASEAILALKPVTFRYKHELDPDGIPQFGLVAEEVEKVNPALVARDDRGKAYTVRYEAVNAMLLNEFLKEHKKVEKLEGVVGSLAATVKEQATQIQKVSAQLEASQPAPQMVNNP